MDHTEIASFSTSASLWDFAGLRCNCKLRYQSAYLAFMRPWVWFLTLKCVVVAKACNLSTREVDAEGSEVQHSQIYSKFNTIGIYESPSQTQTETGRQTDTGLHTHIPLLNPEGPGRGLSCCSSFSAAGDGGGSSVRPRFPGLRILPLPETLSIP